MKKNILLSLLLLFTTCLIAQAQIINLHSFNVGDGVIPYGNVVSDGTYLYGMTQGGGTHLDGMIFKIKLDGSGYDTVLNFSGPTQGRTPHGSLIYDGTYLYGMASNGGIYDNGVVFKIKPDGTGYLKLHDFQSLDGSVPDDNLIYDGTFLYGMTRLGGVSGVGVIFKIQPDGSNFTKLFDFNAAVSGSHPMGSLYYDGTFLYGTTNDGGLHNYGVVFKIKPDGTSYLDLKDFFYPTGVLPASGSLVSDGTFLYGTLYYGGIYNKGTVFKIKYDGTAYSDIFNFSGVANGTNPGSLYYDGTFLYGLTYLGGINDSTSSGDGVIYKIKPDGTSFSKLYDFDITHGRWPAGTLISDGTSFYGMTSKGGPSGRGNVFKFQEITTQVNENNFSEYFSISPNPSTGKLNVVKKDQKNLLSELEVYNILGEKIHSEFLNATESQIDLSDNKEGIYFIKIKSEHENSVIKIIIQK